MSIGRRGSHFASFSERGRQVPNLRTVVGMSDDRLLRRKTRLWLYLILLLHLVCLALLYQPAAPESTHAGGNFARTAVVAPPPAA